MLSGSFRIDTNKLACQTCLLWVTGWLVYDPFLIVSLSGWPVYNPNPLRSNPNLKKPMSGSCRVRGLGRILTPLVMRDYLRHFWLVPIQCAVNVFRILGSVDALNEKMGLRLTYHDVNWCYNLQYLKGKTYYMKARDERVRLIQCLPKSSKGLNKDFLIISGAWHDGLPCPT